MNIEDALKQELNLDGRRGWGPEIIDTIIAVKKAKRALKGEFPQIFSFDYRNKNYRTPSNAYVEPKKIESTLDKTFEVIRSKLDEINIEPINLYLAITSPPDGHTSGLVVQIDQNKKVNFFIFDSAGYSPYELLYSYYLISLLKQKFGEENCQCYLFNEQIQSDHSSCQRITLDALFHLSKMDIFSILAKRSNELKENDDLFGKDYKKLSADSLPNELAFLYRNMQSLKKIDSLPERLKNQKINSKGSLAKNIRNRTENVMNEEKKRQNRSAAYKNNTWLQSALDMIEKTPELEEQINSVDLLNALDKNLFLNTSAIRELVENLKTVEDKLPELIQNSFQLADVLKNLDETQRTIVLKAFEERLTDGSQLDPDNRKKIFNAILNYASEPNKTELLLSLNHDLRQEFYAIVKQNLKPDQNNESAYQQLDQYILHKLSKEPDVRDALKKYVSKDLHSKLSAALWLQSVLFGTVPFEKKDYDMHKSSLKDGRLHQIVKESSFAQIKQVTQTMKEQLSTIKNSSDDASSLGVENIKKP